MPAPKPRSFWAAWLCLSLAACTSVGEHPAPPDEISAVRDGSNVAVLVRFDGEDQNGKPLRPLANDASHIPFGLLIGDSDSAGVPTYEAFEIRPPHQMLLIQFDEGGHVLRADRTEAPSDANLQEFLRTWAEKGNASGKL